MNPLRRAAALAAALLTALGVFVMTPTAASADPATGIWKCYEARWQVHTISKYEYYGCPWGTIYIVNTYTGNFETVVDGYCANQLWQKSNRKATWQDAIRVCGHPY